MLNETVMASCWVVFIMLIWFQSDAFEYYLRYFGVGHWLNIDTYDKEDPDKDLEYLDFIRVKYKSRSFVVALVTCPTCLCVWLCIAACLTFKCIYYFPIVFLSSLIVYLLVERIFYANTDRL